VLFIYFILHNDKFINVELLSSFSLTAQIS